MKLEVLETAWYRAQLPGLDMATSTAIYDAMSVYEEWVKDLIVAEYLEFPVLLKDDQTWELSPVPYTILDPFSIPDQPTPYSDDTYYNYQEALKKTYGPDVAVDAWEFTIYRSEFLTEGQPFTVLGSWSDVGGAQGIFGVAKGGTRAIVLFC